NTMLEDIKKQVLEGKKKAWSNYLNPIKEEQKEAVALLEKVAASSTNKVVIECLISDLKASKEPIRKEILSTARKVLRLVIGEASHNELAGWITAYKEKIQPNFSSHLFSSSDKNIFSVKEVKPQYDESAELVDARLVIRDNFDAIFSKYPESLIFGEDSGHIGDVNQGLEGLQEKYGELRVSDAGIREATILGQGIGMALRGLRPIAEIQYLDYLLYAIQIM